MKLKINLSMKRKLGLLIGKPIIIEFNNINKIDTKINDNDELEVNIANYSK